jgi:hypothetical protein
MAEGATNNQDLNGHVFQSMHADEEGAGRAAGDELDVERPLLSGKYFDIDVDVGLSDAGTHSFPYLQ